MEFLNELMPLVIYILVAILLVVLIVLVIKLFTTVDKTNAVLEDLEKKSKSLDGIFGAVDSLTDTISLASDRLIDGAASLVSKVINAGKKKRDRRKKGEEEDE